MRPLFALLLVACSQPAHTLSAAARQEVYSTATCPTVEVSHVPASDIAGDREDVYVAEGCGMRWVMTCESKRALVCPRRSRHGCRDELQWSCDNVQPDREVSDDELRARVVHPDDMNVLGS